MQRRDREAVLLSALNIDTVALLRPHFRFAKLATVWARAGYLVLVDRGNDVESMRSVYLLPRLWGARSECESYCELVMPASKTHCVPEVATTCKNPCR
eukprot:708819-Amphidinium_carterae.1